MAAAAITTKKFQEGASKLFLATAQLELDLIRSDLAEMAVRFADLLMKQKLLFKEDCRDHSKSFELITAVFIREPHNHARDESDDSMITDTHETEDELNGNINGLRFGVDDKFIYNTLSIPDINGRQPDKLRENEIKLIMETKKDLKNTLHRGIRCFHSQLRKIKMINTTKEVLLESATVQKANATANTLNEGDGDNGDNLPQDSESLHELIGAIVLEKLNNNKIKKPKQKKEVKDQRGAQRQGTQGGGASPNTNTAAKKKKKKAKSKKKKKAAAEKAAAVEQGSVAASSNKRRRPPTESS